MTLQLKDSFCATLLPKYSKLPEYKDLPAMDNEQHSPAQATAPTVHKVIMFCRLSLVTLCAIALIVFEVVDYHGRKLIDTELGSITKNVATTLCHDLIMTLLQDWMRINGMEIMWSFLSLIVGAIMSISQYFMLAR
ncbi:uncharacterized protein BKCO1_700029 [Diplodia corticola]|uniref:Uncharacterized protein n=1 Tax=Diplodia corticola TaxID=236234 RepID=A0A1J9RXH8_9PEZI|nr:uncharacterized protein BKCO1_700029 [Diplodia corticola]OJD37355.1 hypothetical protein BKCO1_700029 [Diplodia corticola]